MKLYPSAIFDFASDDVVASILANCNYEALAAQQVLRGVDHGVSWGRFGEFLRGCIPPRKWHPKTTPLGEIVVYTAL